MRKNNIYEIFIYNFLAILYSWSMVFSVTRSMNFEIKRLTVLVYCLAMILFLNIFLLNRITVLAGCVIFASVLIYNGYKIIELNMLSNLHGKMSEFFTWVYDYMMGYQYLNETFSIYFTVIITLLVCFITFILVVKDSRFYVLLTGGLLFFIITMSLGYKVDLPGFMVYLFCTICLFGREIFDKKLKALLPKERKQSTYIYVLWVMPFAVLIVFLSALASTSIHHEKPEWVDKGVDTFKQWYEKQNWFEGFEQRKGSDFSLVSTGFQPDRNSIGGNISRLDDRLVLNVKSDHRVYLKGSIRDYYTGKSWINTNNQEFSITDHVIENYITDNFFSSRKFFFQLLRWSKYRNSNYSRIYEQVFLNGNAEVEHVNFRTNAIFYPDNLISILERNNEKNYVITNSNAEFYFPGRAQNNSQYSYQYRVVDRSNPVAEELLKLSSPAVIKPLIDSNSDVRDKYLEIKNKYTNTENILPRVADLAKEITKDYKNRYEKVKAIEKYLSSNYQYTLTPGFTPEDRDFVDYFLFELKKGYCTYYASAMTVMVRSLGIPARYVEGYVLPLKPDENKIYKVTNDLSHAWVEVFFEGFGWVRFEPTAPFNALLDNRQDNTQPLPQGIIYGEDYYEEYLNRLIGGSSLDLPVQSEIQNPVAAPALKGKTLLIVFICMIIAGLMVLIFSTRRLFFNFRMGKIKHMNAKKGIVTVYHMILSLMHLYNCEIKPGETPLEYAKRVDEWFINSSDSFYNITELYMKAKYSKLPMQEQDKKRMVDFYHAVVKDLGDRGRFCVTFNYLFIELKYKIHVTGESAPCRKDDF